MTDQLIEFSLFKSKVMLWLGLECSQWSRTFRSFIKGHSNRELGQWEVRHNRTDATA